MPPRLTLGSSAMTIVGPCKAGLLKDILFVPPHCLNPRRSFWHYIIWPGGQIPRENLGYRAPCPCLYFLSDPEASMPSATHEAPARRQSQQPRKRPSALFISHRTTHSNDSRTSFSTSSDAPPSPTPPAPAPSPRAIEISAAFERVHDHSTALRTCLLPGSSSETVMTLRARVEEFQGAVTILFRELQRLPDDVPPTPTLISATQGCSFEVHCFGSSVEMYCGEWRRVRCEEERQQQQQDELREMLNEAMASMCQLLEFAAQAIEDAEVGREQREEESEVDSNEAEHGSGSSMDGRPVSWLARAKGAWSDPPVSPQRWRIVCSSVLTPRPKGTKAKAIPGRTSKKGLPDEPEETACTHPSSDPQPARVLTERIPDPHQASKQKQIRHPPAQELRPPLPSRGRSTAAATSRFPRDHRRFGTVPTGRQAPQTQQQPRRPRRRSLYRIQPR